MILRFAIPEDAIASESFNGTPGAGTGFMWPHSCSENQREPRAVPNSWEVVSMNLIVWLPAMFFLGLVSMGLCYAFIGACEKI